MPSRRASSAAASRSRSRSRDGPASAAVPSEEHPTGRPDPSTDIAPATATPWSPSRRPTPRSACSRPPQPPAARSAPASQPTPAPSTHASTAPAPHDHPDATPMQGQDDSPCLMISDHELPRDLRHAPLGPDSAPLLSSRVYSALAICSFYQEDTIGAEEAIRLAVE